MVKRSHDGEPSDSEPSPKRSRLCSIDRFSRLSDELVLRILSYLPVSELALSQRLSSRYRTLAGDRSLWRTLYYTRFVRPRASRLPGLRDGDGSVERAGVKSRTSRWLEAEHLVNRGVKTDWKRQYKLRQNWARGSCAVDEIQVADEVVIPPVLVQMCDGVIYIVDQADGLRAWSVKADRKLVAHLKFPDRTAPPTSLAVDATLTNASISMIVVGFEDGAFSIYHFNHTDPRFLHRYSHEPSTNGVISAVALVWPYVVTMTAMQLLSLYRFDEASKHTSTAGSLDPPRLLNSLRSQTVWPPLSTSLRVSASSVTMTIAYALPTYLSGWTVGVQELQVTRQGDFLESRLASAIDQHYRPLAFAAPPVMHHLPPASGLLATSTTPEFRHIHSKPTSLSYTHPYLLVSHPDNTLTLYLVSSTADSLSISSGSRLWGHTSSVSGAHVGGRGKAVSISRKGDELRVWELEGGFVSSTARKRLASGSLSVQIRPESKVPPASDVAHAEEEVIDSGPKEKCARLYEAEPTIEESSDLTLTRGWVGFDEENVVVLKEQGHGRQALVIYDFT